MIPETYDVVIVGAGAAGLSAAIYTARREMKSLVISKDLGGQAAFSSRIENYPGFKRINGTKLMSRFNKEALDCGVDFVYGEEINRIKKAENGFILKSEKNEYFGKTVILAFGKTPKNLGVPGEREFIGKGVSYCATCDAPFFKNKTVVIVGNVYPALDAAILLSKMAKQIYLLNEKEKFAAETKMIGKVRALKNCEIMLNHEMAEIKGTSLVKSIIVKNITSGEIKEIQTDGVFIELGYEVKTDWLKGVIKVNPEREIIINDKCETSIPGIFAAGDVTTVCYKQIVICAGEGAKAGLQAYNYLIGKDSSIKADWD